MYKTTPLFLLVGILMSFSLFSQIPATDECWLPHVSEETMNDMDNNEKKKTQRSVRRQYRNYKPPSLPVTIPFIIPSVFPAFQCNPNRTIPVVFHVIHSCGIEKVNPSQIKGALKDVNDDFNAMNEDRLKIGEPFFEDQANVGLNFVLAEKDPFGNATSGINYIEQVPGLSRKDIQQMTSWSRDKYLNVWVIPKLPGASGYAFYPYLVDRPEEAYKDGIVIVHRYLGTTETADSSAENYHGRRHILTHEIGHWLGLEHAWGDNIVNGIPRYQEVGNPGNCQYDDKVLDTPNTIGDAEIIYSRPIFAGEEYIENNTDLPHTCASAPPGGGDYDNIFNFMDYGCEVMFTHGQKERMHNALCSRIAQRRSIGTNNSNRATLLDVIDSRKPKIQTSEYFFFESYQNDGSIENCIEIEIRGGRGNFLRRQRRGLLIPNVDFIVTNAKDYQVEIQVNPNDARRATICLKGKTLRNRKVNNVDNMSIQFIGESISGQDVFNRNLSGLKIIYKDDYVVGYNKYSSDDHTKDAKVIEYEHFDQDAFFSDVIGELGVVADVERGEESNDALERFLLYSASEYDVKVLCHANTKDIALLYEGEVVANMVGEGEYTYKTAATGLNSQAISFNPDDWKGKTGYIGISATSGCNGLSYYAWARVGMSDDEQEFYIYDMGYPTGPNLPVKINTKALCSADAERKDISGIDRIKIDDFVSQSGHNGGYRDFTHKTINLEAGEEYDLRFRQTGSGNTLTEWYIWVDFNSNGCFSDPNELIFNSHIETSGDIKKEFVLLNHKLLKDDVSAGTYIMRIACNPRSIESPCGIWRAGEREDYTIEVDNNDCQQPINVASLNADFIDNTTVEISATPIDGARYYYFYWGKKTANVNTWERIITTSPSTILDNLDADEVYGFYLKVQYKSSYCGVSTTSSDSQVRFFKTSTQAYFSGNSTNTE